MIALPRCCWCACDGAIEIRPLLVRDWESGTGVVKV